MEITYNVHCGVSCGVLSTLYVKYHNKINYRLHIYIGSTQIICHWWHWMRNKKNVCGHVEGFGETAAFGWKIPLSGDGRELASLFRVSLGGGGQELYAIC